jgi:sialate O-acetylesterase
MRLFLVALAFLLDSGLLGAEVQMPAIFGDHMVLQEEKKLPIWGTAAPGEVVTVTLGAASAGATADARGDWRVDFPPLPPDEKPLTLSVKGGNALTFTDVLAGEVWLFSGQSNMAMPVAGTVDAAKDIPAANDPGLRLFLVAQKTSLDPLTNVQGEWKLCTPAAAAGFSAIGYYFGRELRHHLNRPVGLIGSYWGATPAEAWTSLPALQAKPALKSYVEAFEKTKANYSAALAAYPTRLRQYQDELLAWRQSPAGIALDAKIKAWTAVMAKPQHRGGPDTPRPTPPPGAPVPPLPPDGGSREPASLFNAMIAPLIPYAVRGAIWYQGEGNAARGYEYRTLFPALITDWRERWGEGDFPFLYVQLAGYNAGPIQSWPYLREAQALTLSLPNTGMATAVDIGNPGYIHPQDKKDVSHRLMLLAQDIAYGGHVPDAGPLYRAMTVKDGAIEVAFTHAESGLKIGQAPWVASGVKPLPADRLVGFTVAGADHRWFVANAKIEGSSVVISSPIVAAPVAVRYDWANAPRGNLDNRANLPAPPFRTDDWPDPAMGPPGPTPSR